MTPGPIGAPFVIPNGSILVLPSTEEGELITVDARAASAQASRGSAGVPLVSTAPVHAAGRPLLVSEVVGLDKADRGNLANKGVVILKSSIGEPK